MEELGQIVEVNGQEAVVKIKKQSACSKCTQKCHLANNSSEIDEIEIRVNNHIGVKKGQIVKLEMEGQPLVIASLIIYLFPLLSLIGGYFVGLYLAPSLGLPSSEQIGVISSLLLFIIAFFVVRFLNKIVERKESFQPKITNILE